MLPPALRHLHDALDQKDSNSRSLFEDVILDELKGVDNALDKAKERQNDLTEGIEKKGGYPFSVVGPAPGSCQICGKII